ncbi:Putative universal stress protein [Pigmentiphaga humi]|uniref:Universal stress protein n=1 Tax=Pigmentiphaga humi TaxID=2478468 RepID=A0A3P4B243_9BURK|nr:universal stress protein [Pigmentiphaga humi]VCU69951.1 Putative universal stress protein [Pigmentiphaga humi]
MGDTCSILLATDLSPRCDRALDRAIAIARRRRCKLVVLHVIEEPALAERLMAQRSRDADAAGAERLLRDIVGETDVPVELVLESGNPVERIRETARVRQCDLIVTGTARQETLGRLLLGSTVEKLARESTLPVLIVKQRPHRAYGQVVAASDFSEGARQAMNAARAFFADAQLTLLHAYPTLRADPDAGELAQARKQAEQAANAFVAGNVAQLSQSVRLVMQHGMPEAVVPEYVRAHGADLLVVGTHGHTGLLRTALGSVAERLIYLTPCDALIVRTV